MHPSDTLVYRPFMLWGFPPRTKVWLTSASMVGRDLKVEASFHARRVAEMTPFCGPKVLIEGPLFSGGCHERAPRSDIFGSERQWYTEGVFASLEGPGGVSPWQPPKKSGHSGAGMTTFCDTIIAWGYELLK